MSFPSRKDTEGGFWLADPCLKDIAAEMWVTGKSASEIARAIGAPSRNAVIGKISRMGLQRTTAAQRASQVAARARQAAVKENERIARARLKAEVTAKRDRGERKDGGQGLVAIIKGRAMTALPLPPTRDTDIARVPDARRGCCKWPVGEPGTPDFGFCGLPAERTYCDAHRKAGTLGLPTNLRGIAGYAAKTDRLGPRL